MRSFLFCLLSAGSLWAASPAQLSDAEVQSALSGAGRNHQVFIQDQGLWAAQGSRVPAIGLYLPEALIAVGKERAQRQFLHYVPTEVEREQALTVLAQGFVSESVAVGCDSITRIVLLSDPAGTVTEEAYRMAPLTETWGNSYGATNSCQTLVAKFSFDALQRVRAAAHNGEFYVAVFAGSEPTKVYKIKRKHQAKLGLS